MATTLISTENFWFLLALIALFNVLMFIVSTGNEETRMRLVTAKNNKEIDREETATILITIAMSIPIFIGFCFFIIKGTNIDFSSLPGNVLIKMLFHIVAWATIIMISLIATFAAWVIFLIFTIFSYYLLIWQEKSKLVRKNNKLMLANSSLIAAAIFSLSICLTLVPINNFLIIFLASAIPAIFLYSQETFFCIKNLSKKTA